jgi:hypothetical protein
LYIGYYESNPYGAARHYYGALAAQGTAAQPIVLTAASGVPGGWNGVSFRAQTNGPLSRLEQCVIEYGGQTTGVNVYLEHASPTIRDKRPQSRVTS